MGYFDALAASSFKDLENGKRAFYPWGRFGKGYELQTEEQYEAIKRTIIRGYVTIVPLAILAGALRLWIVIAVVVPIALVAYVLVLRRLTRGLPTTREKLTFKDTSETQARRQSPVLLWSMLILSLLFVAGGIALIAMTEELLIGLLCTGFFGACAALYVWMLLLRRRVLREADPEKTRVFD